MGTMNVALRSKSQTEMLMESVSGLAEALKQCSDIAQKSVDQVNYYAQVAEVAIEVVGVMQAHLAFLAEKERGNFEADLQARGLPSPEAMRKLLSKIARKEF